MKLAVFLFLAMSNFTMLAQGVKVINSANLENLPKGVKFTFIEPSTDTSNFKYVATFQGKDRIRKSNIENLYFVIREKANKLGANCFRIMSFNIDEVKDEVILILDGYYATDSMLTVNRSNHEKNVVYIFGGEKENEKSISFQINGETKELKSGTYHKIVLSEGDAISVNKGGMTGTSMLLKFQNDSLPAFYTLSGFGLSSFEQQPTHGIAFKTGGINRISNISLGLLMTQLLQEGN
jgi:hypothetical protein